MKSIHIFSLSLLLYGTALAVGTAPVDELAKYNVVWNSPSQDAHGSMPIGNGDVGINAWVEPSGDLVFYVSKTDAWDENGRLCKIGRVRVKFDPPIPTKGFRQELKLRDGVIEVSAGETRLALWVDAKAPVVRVDANFGTAVNCRAEVEIWRQHERPFGDDDDSHSSRGLSGQAFKPTVLPDIVVTSAAPRVVWYHRNTRSIFPLCMDVQHLESLKGRFADPLLGHTFGACLSGKGMIRDGAQALKSKSPSKHHEVSVSVLAERAATAEIWLKDLARTEIADAKKSRAQTGRWWNEFWNRSWAFVDANTVPLPHCVQRPFIRRYGDTVVEDMPFKGDTSVETVTQWEITGPYTKAGKSGPELYDEVFPPETDPKAGEWRPFTEPTTSRAGVRTEPGVVDLDVFNGEGSKNACAYARCSICAYQGRSNATMTFETGHGGKVWLNGELIIAANHPGSYSETKKGIIKQGWNTILVKVNQGAKPGEFWFKFGTVASGCGDIVALAGLPTNERASDPSAGALLTQGYVLQRYMNACSGRGVAPIKFNGSIFTVEAKPGASPETPAGDPDWRRWGGNYWFQNSRLSYWPTLASGDFEMLEPWFRMYRDALHLSKARIETYYKFQNAAQFPETMYFWGMPNNFDYGWGNTAPEPSSTYIRRYWSGNLELIAVMLDRYDFTQDARFARETLVPLADPLIAFFDQYWPKRDANGKIRFDPAQSLETWQAAVNPMPEIAGLKFLLPRLLALPEDVTTGSQRSRWTRILGELPPIPVTEVNGKRRLQPAEEFSKYSNAENPELYAVFPYRLFGIGRSDLDMARDTYQLRRTRLNRCWGQDSIQAACLGLGEEAGSLAVGRAAQINRDHRFPAMWGPNYDWAPDQDHGNNILTTLQCMLLQSNGDKIYLLPAWPKGWSVSFKLHAPRDTIVEGEYRDGKLTELKVSPPSRRADIQLMLPAVEGGRQK